jgi:PAS domain S-box-containing protein
MWSRMSLWLHTVPLSDPVERKQAPVVQVVLLLLIIGGCLGIPINLNAVGGPEGQLLALTSNLVIMISTASALMFLRRGQFRTAIMLCTTGLQIGLIFNCIAVGVKTGSALLCAFLLPIVISGFLAGRRGLLVSVPTSITIVITTALLELQHPGLIGFTAREGIPIGLTLVTFCLITCLLGLFIDQFGSSLRTALSESQARERELTRIHASLEIQAAELLETKENLESELAVRKKAEAELAFERDLLHALMDSAQDMIYFKDTASRFTRINRAQVRMLGISEPEQAVGKTDFDFFSATGLAQGFYDEEQKIVASGQPLVDRLEYNPTSDGRPRWLSATKVPIKGAEGQVVGIVGISRDITLRYEVERVKNEFIAMVSHELRTPLTAIRGALDLIASGATGPLSGELQYMIDIACRNGERLHNLISDILDIEQIETGKLRFTPAQFDLCELVRQGIDMNSSYAASLGVTFQLQLPPTKLSVYVDSDRLMQVLTNLLSNAAKFSQPGDTVEVMVAQADRIARVTITDHGPGIAEAFRDRIFEKFAQADSSDSRQKGGSGLGLSIAKGIIEQLGGQIGFTSVSGVGSTFYIELPLIRAAH